MNAAGDQAGELRRLVEEKRQAIRRRGRLRTVAVLSGKGGVGKSNLALSLACAMADRGKRVVVMDADLGLANLDLLCGVSPQHNLSHLVEGSRGLTEVLTPVPREERVTLLSGGVGLKAMADLDDDALQRVFGALEDLESRADVLILDTGAGIHHGVLAFAHAADLTLLVTTPEPTSVRDAYGVIKSLGPAEAGRELLLVVNMASSRAEALDVADRIRRASARFLRRSPSYLGCVLRDACVERAVRGRGIFYRASPYSSASRCVGELAEALLQWGEERTAPPETRGLRSFFARLARGFFMEK